MYVDQFWKCFEETGNIETYLCIKEYEHLYAERTKCVEKSDTSTATMEEIDGMK